MVVVARVRGKREGGARSTCEGGGVNEDAENGKRGRGVEVGGDGDPFLFYFVAPRGVGGCPDDVCPGRCAMMMKE